MKIGEGERGSGGRVARCPRDSTLVPPTELSLSEDLDITYGFIFTEYDLDLRVLSGSYEGSKSPKKVGRK